MTMIKLPLIGSLCLRKDFWDRHWANVATCLREMYGERLFRHSKKSILVRDRHFFVVVLSEMSVDNIDIRVAQGFVRTIEKYLVKSSD